LVSVAASMHRSRESSPSVSSSDPRLRSQTQIPGSNPRLKSQAQIPGSDPRLRSQAQIPGSDPRLRSQAQIPSSDPSPRSGSLSSGSAGVWLAELGKGQRRSEKASEGQRRPAKVPHGQSKSDTARDGPRRSGKIGKTGEARGSSGKLREAFCSPDGRRRSLAGMSNPPRQSACTITLRRAVYPSWRRSQRGGRMDPNASSAAFPFSC